MQQFRDQKQTEGITMAFSQSVHAQFIVTYIEKHSLFLEFQSKMLFYFLAKLFPIFYRD